MKENGEAMGNFLWVEVEGGVRESLRNDLEVGGNYPGRAGATSGHVAGTAVACCAQAGTNSS